MAEQLHYRPLVLGRRGIVTAGHYLGAAAGYRIMLEGGNAVDAAAATALVLSIVEQQENSFGGEAPILVYSAADKKPFAISGVGTAPAALSIDWFAENGIDMIPSDGFLPITVPAQIGTWGLALARFGTKSFADVAKPAIELAENGFPAYADLLWEVDNSKDKFKERYPSTCDIYMPGGEVPAVGDIIYNPDLASMLKSLCEREAAKTERVAGIEAAVDEFYRGEVARRIVEFINEKPVLDDSGKEHTGLLTLEDLAGWSAEIEEPLSLDYKGLTVHKCSSWTQGPVFLQQLSLLAGYDLPALGHYSVEYCHTLIECAKLAYADREAYYGDPNFDEVPFGVLLSEKYAEERRRLVAETASARLRPGDAGGGIPGWATFDVLADNRESLGFASEGNGGTGENCDTTQLDAADSVGNMVSATPSGGWIASSPVVKGLGFPLGTRAQMFYLNPARPNALAPGKRPRATLTPSLVTKDGGPYMVFGMRGGDMQDQMTLHFFLNHVEFGMDVQSALDVPGFTIYHMPDSFYPRKAFPKKVVFDNGFDRDAVRELKKLGHDAYMFKETSHKMMAIRRDPETGVLSGGACSSGETAHCIGW